MSVDLYAFDKHFVERYSLRCAHQQPRNHLVVVILVIISVRNAQILLTHDLPRRLFMTIPSADQTALVQARFLFRLCEARNQLGGQRPECTKKTPLFSECRPFLLLIERLLCRHVTASSFLACETTIGAQKGKQDSNNEQQTDFESLPRLIERFWCRHVADSSLSSW